MPETRRAWDIINFAKARMTRFYTETRYFRPPEPAQHVMVGDAGAGASKALFDTVPNVKDSPKS
jgi:hypothetical protein